MPQTVDSEELHSSIQAVENRLELVGQDGAVQENTAGKGPNAHPFMEPGIQVFGDASSHTTAQTDYVVDSAPAVCQPEMNGIKEASSAK